MPLNLPQALRMKMQTPRPRLAISMADGYDYNILGDDADPDDLYEELIKHNHVLTESLQSSSNPRGDTIVDEFLLDLLSKTIFGSNYIEQAGAGLAITLQLCHAIFSGETVPDEITEHDPEYQALKDDLAHQNLPPGPPAILLRRRCEIVQHARAASFILNEVYLKENDLSEENILETHRILTHKVDTDDEYPWQKYSGVYRTVPVSAGLHSFPPPERVPAGMRQLITALNRDLAGAAASGAIDPVALAAKYSQKFVCLHPFVDGNGRTCRLILNVLLVKYGVLPAPIGQDAATREKYLEIAAAASEREASEGVQWDDDEEGAPKSYKALATFTLKFVTDEMRALVGKLKGKGGGDGGVDGGV
ncbi:Fic-domain-containing protein [Podospora conica]|nr:Fic-domain-containing protein [Schizothecium conicum]